MWTKPKDDRVIMKALQLSNTGHHRQAPKLLQDAGNQYRNPEEKKILWEAAKRSQKIADSD